MNKDQTANQAFPPSSLWRMAATAVPIAFAGSFLPYHMMSSSYADTEKLAKLQQRQDELKTVQAEKGDSHLVEKARTFYLPCTSIGVTFGRNKTVTDALQQNKEEMALERAKGMPFDLMCSAPFAAATALAAAHLFEKPRQSFLSRIGF